MDELLLGILFSKSFFVIFFKKQKIFSKFSCNLENNFFPNTCLWKIFFDKICKMKIFKKNLQQEFVKKYCKENGFEKKIGKKFLEKILQNKILEKNLQKTICEKKFFGKKL